MKPVLGILLGDATGIGPEIVAKVFGDDDLLDYCRPIIIGDRRVLELGKDITGINFSINEFDEPSQAECPELSFEPVSTFT